MAPPPPSALDTVAAPARPAWWKVGGLAVAGMAGCAYVALNDPNTSTLFPACPFKTVTGLDCPGCGITRALHALFTGDLVGALDQNLLFVVALPLLLWFGVRGALRPSSRAASAPTRRWRPWTTWALAATLAGFWVVRNLGWGPLAFLESGFS